MSLYPAAREIAPRLERHIAQHAAAGPSAGAPLPDAAAIEALVDAGCWGRLQRVVGSGAALSRAVLPPGRAVRPMRLAVPLPLGRRALERLAPVVEGQVIHLGVWREGGELGVWGTTRAIASF